MDAVAMIADVINWFTTHEPHPKKKTDLSLSVF